MRIALWLLVLMWLPGGASAFETADIAGLDVHVEALPDPVVVDGASFLIRRATGPSTSELVERVRLRWVAQGSATRAFQSGPWRVISRWSGDTSEVLQFRTVEGIPEAVHSTYRPDTGKARVRSAPFSLPANCAWGRSISGRTSGSAYEQLSAYCRGSPETGRKSMLALLREAGWQVQGTGMSAFHVTRTDHEALLVIARTTGGGGYGLIWMDVLESGGVSR